jgi:hypothetical protein
MIRRDSFRSVSACAVAVLMSRVQCELSQMGKSARQNREKCNCRR